MAARAELSPVRDRAEAIRQELVQAERAWQSALGHAIRAGELLAEQKASLGHGEWLPWLAEHVPELPERTARRYMQLAANRELVAGLPTVRAAIAALAEPPPTKTATVADLPKAADRTPSVPIPALPPRAEPQPEARPEPEPEPTESPRPVRVFTCPQCGHREGPACSCASTAPATLAPDGRCQRCWGWPLA